VEIINWAILLFLVCIMPLGLGMIPVKYMEKEHRTPAMLYVCGWFVSFSVFELVSIPFILLQRRFSELAVFYTIAVFLLFFISVWRGRGVVADCLRKFGNFKELTLWSRIGWGIGIVLIAGQVLAAVFLEYWDGDDSYYMAQALIANTYDVMYTRDAYTGYEFGFDIRHALSPVPIYYAWLSALSGIHAVIIAHSVIAPIWILLMYSVYALLADKLLEHHRSYKPLFLILISIWLYFGNVSINTAETFAITRIWQGKGLMAGIIMPLLFLCFFYLQEVKVSKGIWVLFVLTITASGLATSTSLMLVPTVVGLAAILIGYQKRCLGFAVKMLLGCLPCIVLGLIFVGMS